MKLNISRAITERRKQLNLTQEEIASRLGVTSQAVSNWERETGYPSVALIPSLAGALGITTDELFGIGAGNNERIMESLKTDIRLSSDPDDVKRVIRGYYHWYPGNYHMMGWMMWYIYREFRNDPDLVELAKEMGARILSGCTDDPTRVTALKVMSFIYKDTEVDEPVAF